MATRVCCCCWAYSWLTRPSLSPQKRSMTTEPLGWLFTTLLWVQKKNRSCLNSCFWVLLSAFCRFAFFRKDLFFTIAHWVTFKWQYGFFYCSIAQNWCSISVGGGGLISASASVINLPGVEISGFQKPLFCSFQSKPGSWPACQDISAAAA